MTLHATGSFEVKVAPLEPAFRFDESSLGRMSLEKQFHGDLEAASRGEMLTAGDPKSGFGGYVAMERVTGSLNQRSGTFVLQHSATMQNGAYTLNITVVPGSATGQLVGLSGVMSILIKEGKHSYDFTYSLPAAP